MIKNYEEIGNLAVFMLEAIKANPENKGADGVNWDFVSADVYMDYKGPFNDMMIEDAIDLIIEAAETKVVYH